MEPGRFVFANFTAEDCTYAMNLQHDRRLLVAYTIQVLMAAISLTSILFMCLAPKFRQTQSLLSDSIRIVFSAGFVFYIICPIITFFFYSYLILISFLPFNSCFYIWSDISCYIPRYPAYYCTVGFTTSHITVLVERLHTILSPQKQTSRSFAYAIAAVTLLAPLPIITWGYALDSFNGYRIYPLPGSTGNVQRVLTIKIASAWTDGFTLFADFILLLYNRRQLKMRLANYNLNESYRIRELRLSIELIWPMMWIHSLSLMPYFFFSWLATATNTVPVVDELMVKNEFVLVLKGLYMMIVPFSLCVLYHFRNRRVTDGEWQRSSINATDEYFQQFNRQLQ